MKKLLVGLVFSSLSLFFANSVFADPPLPSNCPSSHAIRAQGVSTRVIKLDGAWIAGRRHLKYNTDNLWTFVLMDIRAASSSDAYDKATKALKSLNFQFGPVIVENRWVCVYNTREGYPGYTINPPIAFEDVKNVVSKI